VEKPIVKGGYEQAVIQWVRQNSRGVIQNVVETSLPKRVGRWSAQRSKDGYYRLYRKIGGRVHSIYIGKELDVDKAERKIADRERELLSPSPGLSTTASTRRKSQIKMETPPRVIGSPRDRRDK